MKKIAFVLSLVIFLAACNKKPKPGAVSIAVKHMVGDKNLTTNQVIYDAPVGHKYSVNKYWYYLSDIKLVGKEGTFTEGKGHLIKVEDEKNYDIVLENVTADKYAKIEFQFGFSKANNVESYLESTLDNQNMFWPTQLGPGAYHYMKLEGAYDSLSTGNMKSYIMHAGPTNGADNSFTVSFDVDEFEINDNTASINLKVDLLEWLQDPTNYNFDEHKMVMMNQNTQDVYKANGKSVFSIVK